MDDRYEFNQYAGRRPKRTPGEAMAGNALILSIVALISVCCIYPGLICGAIAIMLGLLSRGQSKKALPAGRMAIMLGSAAIALAVAVTVMDFVYVISTYGSIEAFMESYTATLNELTGGAYSDLYGAYGL